MRKVKYTEQSITEKFGAILQDFPRLDDIHPFYADLMNILYDRDHFKLALGQVNTAKNLVIGIAKDYLRLMKYGDSLYRCKALKRAALGRMMTVIKKLKASLGYLEEVRKHLSRLPALDPNTRTLLLTGYPNVGKSSFMNKVTRADVDVQPYAFTTKALFVGHMDHRFLRWQVVDTPGILDRPLEERNTIEMQAITALAHLQCCVLYFLDISEQCGYTLDEQLKLYESIRPLFANKQVLIVANKTDILPYANLPAPVRMNIEEIARRSNAELVPMSNVSEENVGILKCKACDKLLEARVDAKLSAGRMKDDVMSRVTVAMPKPRDGVQREAFIPDSVLSRIGDSAMEIGERVTEKQLMIQNGGAGVYVCDYRKYYLLEEDEWRFDTIPEFMDGKNVMDYFDPEIEERLKALDDEEAELEARGAYELEEDIDEIDEEEMLLYETIKDKEAVARKDHHLKIGNVPRKISTRGRDSESIKQHLESVGLDSEGVIESTRGRKRTRESSEAPAESSRSKSHGRPDLPRDASVTRRGSNSKSSKAIRVRSQSATRGPTANSVAPTQRRQVEKGVKSKERRLNRFAKRSEADREHYPKLVKHLNSGKRSLGTSTIGR